MRCADCALESGHNSAPLFRRTCRDFRKRNIDAVVLGITTIISVLAGLLVGMWPAFRVSNTASVASEVARRGRARQQRRTTTARPRSARDCTSRSCGRVARSGRINAEEFLAFAAGAAWIRSAWSVDHDHRAAGSRATIHRRKIVRFYDQLLEKLRRLPGVSAAAICSNAPFDHNEWDSSFHITGTPPDPPGQEPGSEMAIVSPDYFRALGMQILRGRDFGPADVSGRPATAVIDELAAQKFFLASINRETDRRSSYHWRQQREGPFRSPLLESFRTPAIMRRATKLMFGICQ